MEARAVFGLAGLAGLLVRLQRALHYAARDVELFRDRACRSVQHIVLIYDEVQHILGVAHATSARRAAASVTRHEGKARAESVTVTVLRTSTK